MALLAHAEAELDQLREQLAWSNRLSQLGMLTAALAHETNNFLTPIHSYAQLALANPENPALREKALKAAIEGTAKAARLSEHILDLAGPNAAIQTGVCRIDRIVESALEMMAPTIKQAQITICTKTSPEEVAIEGLALEQVLINLVSNASQALKERDGRRQITIESQATEHKINISITDNGPGIPPQLHGDLFEPFVTTRRDDTEKGTGMGLSICRQLVEAAGGSIQLANTSEHGSTFLLQLPHANKAHR